MTKHLPFLYSNVVQPMRNDIRQLMIEMQIASEVDLICSYCHFMKFTVPSLDFYQIKDELYFKIIEMKEKYQRVIVEY